VPGLVVVHVVGEDPQAHPDLRGGEARPGRVQHGVGEVLDQPAQLGVEVADRLGRRTQHRITEETDRLDAHEILLDARWRPLVQRAPQASYSICQATSAGSS